MQHLDIYPKANSVITSARSNIKHSVGRQGKEKTHVIIKANVAVMDNVMLNFTANVVYVLLTNPHVNATFSE